MLVAAFTPEVATVRVQRWLGRQSAADLVMSEWTVTEFAGALSIKRRVGTVTEDEYAKARALFDSSAIFSVRVAPVISHHFYLAAKKASQHQTGLYAGDALHLAVCASEGACLCTLDKRLAAAGPQLGVVTLLL